MHKLLGFAEPKSDLYNGYFYIPMPQDNSVIMRVFATNEAGWDHVSVSLKDVERCPTWEEMCFIKDLFFDKTETVIQYHPAESDYVNNDKYCLHMWRPQTETLPIPPSIKVGFAPGKQK
ncbi:MAG: hypothetical protein FWG39_04065 [Alphaproteobacteria bacterium]|nr:hypothetical protein [Alphaproteobacteria bacterium]